MADMNIDDVTPPPRPPGPSLMATIKKLVVTLGLLFVLWLLVMSVGPKLMLPPPAVQTPPPVAIPATPEKPAEEAAPKPAVDDAHIAALEAKLDSLLQKSTEADDARLALIEQKLAAMQAQLDQATAKNAGLSAFVQLKEAFVRGDALGKPLAHLQSLAQNRPEVLEQLTKLAPYADKGAPQLAALQTGFDKAAQNALSPANAHSVMGNVHSLIRIRKVGEVAGADDEAVIARAESRLQAGDVELCVKELSALSQPSANAMALWETQAHIWLNARASMDAIETAIAGSAP